VTIRAELARGDSEPLDGDAVDRLARVEQAARLALEGVREKIDALRRRQSDLRARSDELSGAHAELERRHAVATAERTATKDRLAEVMLELTELRVRTEAVAEGLRRDADIDEAEAMAAPRPEFGEGEDLEALLTSAQAELRRMGLVNPLALEEFRRLEERHRFLADQLDDLERSREELRKVIHAVEAEMETMFTAAFSAVAAAYEENFALLFPGGRGRLRLTEPDHALSSGVEIEAQPLGKRVGRLSLLSGGERSMAALAFLFAVFKARPSPFYILDEVEAALDDANLRRFLRLVDAFRGSTQLVIITHQQQTMEAADLLYGVTMEPGGSSQVLAKAMSEVGSPV
jgi:chromosome segregation protein